MSDVTGGDSAHGRKPNPAGLLDLVARAGVTASETILVGDSPVDLETSRRAGTRICLTRYGFGYRFAGTEFRGDEVFMDAAGGAAEPCERSTSSPRAVSRLHSSGRYISAAQVAAAARASGNFSIA